MPSSVNSFPLSVKIEPDHSAPRVRLSGKADRSNVSRLAAVLQQLADKHDSCVALELHEMEEVDASAVHGFAQSIEALRERRRKLRLASTNRVVQDVFDRHHLTGFFCSCESCACDCPQETCQALDGAWQIDVFTMPSVIPSCREARRRVGMTARAAGFGEESVNDIMFAVGEAVVNAVKYGANGRDDATFTVSCLANSERFCVSISDSGPGFSVDDVLTLEEAAFLEHGRGVYCMNAVMDEVSFHFGSGTTVRMVKLGKSSA